MILFFSSECFITPRIQDPNGQCQIIRLNLWIITNQPKFYYTLYKGVYHSAVIFDYSGANISPWGDLKYPRFYGIIAVAKKPPRAELAALLRWDWWYAIWGLTTGLTIYGFGLRGRYGLCGTKKHGVRTKKHRKALEMRQKIGISLFGSKMLQVRVLSLRPPAVPAPNIRCRHC